jgi:hypothetical protein
MEGIRISMIGSYGIFEIDFKNVLSRINFNLGHFKTSIENSTNALKLSKSKFCPYIWGEMEALTNLINIECQQGKSKNHNTYKLRLSALKKKLSIKHTSLDYLLGKNTLRS